MKPPRTLEMSPTLEGIKRHLEHVSKVLSNISFGSTFSNADASMNLQVYKATGVAPVGPNTEFSVTHTLHWVPNGFMVVSTDRAAHLYKSTTAWTAATNSAPGHIYLKSDIASVAYSIIIL